MKHPPLTRNNDFARAYRRGKNFVHPHLVLYVNKNRQGHTRLGITTSKKIGGAVVRNRARRVLRAAACAVLPLNAGGVDIVLVARGQTPHQKSTTLQKTLAMLLKKAGLPTLLGQTPRPAAGPAPVATGGQGPKAQSGNPANGGGRAAGPGRECLP